MADLFKRNWRLQVGRQEFTGLRIAFKVVRDNDARPNPAEISIYNLKDESRAKVQAENVAVILEAGYGTHLEQLYAGDVRQATHIKDGVDWLTKIKSGDGERQYRTARINLGFNKGTPMVTIVKQIAEATGIPVGNILDKAQQGDVSGALTETVNGMAISGRAFDELDGIMRSLGYQLSIQDGALQALERTATTTESVLVLSASSGLIGSPEAGEKGVVKAKSLLQPGARPGRRVKLESRAIEGFFKVTMATHVGDSHGADWYTDLELLPL